MNQDTLIIWGIAAALTLITAVPVLLRLRHKERQTEQAHVEALRYGLHEPVSLHPVVDPDALHRHGGCVTVCPEHVLGHPGRAGRGRAARALHRARVV